MTIAGSDSGGGAGIQADLKTFAAHRVHGLSALSALTAQSTTEVRAVHPVSTEFVAAQVDTLADDFTIHAVKTGMIGEPETIELILDRVARWSWPLVVDPVMVAASGDRLASDAVVEAFRRLIPRATVVTPNLDEVEVLLGWRPGDADGMARAGRALLQLGA
ncbi:MAG TPA: bifunctional hydroxymethylpyrimidine kinase/phosphomethylpyrimidine kinase, partial [Myxococcales bacterium LLY-WYZ-16_1]|nr:bifunctional hydroxymethylpyrimidine kinase/phosphomethylpyrimidine kinase [Myxococcales bacterium LLY-WYZ-16_1]